MFLQEDQPNAGSSHQQDIYPEAYHLDDLLPEQLDTQARGFYIAETQERSEESAMQTGGYLSQFSTSDRPHTRRRGIPCTITKSEQPITGEIQKPSTIINPSQFGQEVESQGECNAFVLF